PGRGGPRGGGMQIIVDEAGAHMKAPAATLSNVGEMISRFSERPVVDMTGIQGLYEFDLVFSPEVIRGGGGPRGGGPPPGVGGDSGSTAGSIYDSVQKYGLKLEARKAPMDMLIVDKALQAPSEN